MMSALSSDRTSRLAVSPRPRRRAHLWLRPLFWIASLPAVALAAPAVDPLPSPVPPTWLVAESSYVNAGRYSDALRVVRNLQQHLRAVGQAESREYVQVTTQVGVILCRGLGDFGLALDAYREADAVCQRLQGADAFDRVEILNRICEVLVKQRRFTEAAAAGRTAVDIARRVHGDSHPLTADALHYLALALADLPDHGATESVLRRVLQIRRDTEGEAAYWTGLEWNNLGVFHLQHGRLREARDGIEKGAAILAKTVARRTPDAMAVKRNLLRLALEEDNRLEAIRRAEDLFALELDLFRESFGALDERGRIEMKAQFQPGRWYCTLGTPQPIARALLQTKAMTLDQMLAAPETRVESADPYADLLAPENAALGLRPYVRKQSRAAGSSPATPATPEPRARSDRTPSSSPGTQAISPRHVCTALPNHAVAIEFARYPHYVGRFRDEDRYGALVFLPVASGDFSPDAHLRWVPLGSADVIDREINRLLSEATTPLAALTFAARLKTLHALVWAPVAAVLPPNADHVFLSPDGQLCFLPFAGLLDSSGTFLADRHLLMYLSTVRDLFRPDAAGRIQTDRFTVFAAPDFGRAPSARTDQRVTRYRDADLRSLEQLHLVDLPGTRREALLLEQLARNSRLAPALFLGPDATKANVFKEVRPRIVHFATHGFLLAPGQPHTPGNPMDLSGLALTGAQSSLAALARRGPLPAPEEDGLLTARQIAQLPWRGTWLVALSACNTGRGEVRDGESVLGLRRGFHAAGVENLLLALWKIADEDTVEFMGDFYARALATSDAATALALTQRAWLARLRPDRGIAAAVTAAGAFVLNTSHRLPWPRVSSPQAPPPARFSPPP